MKSESVVQVVGRKVVGLENPPRLDAALFKEVDQKSRDVLGLERVKSLWRWMSLDARCGVAIQQFCPRSFIVHCLSLTCALTDKHKCNCLQGPLRQPYKLVDAGLWQMYGDVLPATERCGQFVDDSAESVFSDLMFAELTIRELMKRAEMYAIPGHACVGEVKLFG